MEPFITVELYPGSPLRSRHRYLLKVVLRYLVTFTVTYQAFYCNFYCHLPILLLILFYFYFSFLSYFSLLLSLSHLWATALLIETRFYSRLIKKFLYSCSSSTIWGVSSPLCVILDKANSLQSDVCLTTKTGISILWFMALSSACFVGQRGYVCWAVLMNSAPICIVSIQATGSTLLSFSRISNQSLSTTRHLLGRVGYRCHWL